MVSLFLKCVDYSRDTAIGDTIGIVSPSFRMVSLFLKSVDYSRDTAIGDTIGIVSPSFRSSENFKL